MNESSIIRKIQGLLKIAERSTFPDEAASALSKAQALMLEHKIEADSMGETDNEQVKSFNEPLNADHGKMLASWKMRLAMVLTKNNGCYCYTSGGRIVLVGKPSNADRVRWLFGHCVKSTDKLTKLHCQGEGRTYANNFRLGCIDAIATSIETEKANLIKKLQDNCNERGLVVISQLPIESREARRHLIGKVKLTSKASGQSRYNHSARSHGQRIGSAIYNGNKRSIGC